LLKRAQLAARNRPIAADQDKLIDVIAKSVEFRQTIVTLLFGVAGFALAKSWPDRVSHPERRALRRLLPSILLGSITLIVMLYEQRKLVLAVSGESFRTFSVHWLNYGEPALDVLIVLMALFLFFGLRQ
jgi:hypothetical protein